jgi:hypothetical protein
MRQNCCAVSNIHVPRLLFLRYELKNTKKNDSNGNTAEEEEEEAEEEEE